ncbi:phage/plasmid primase, P4 family [Natronococcus sp. A-GB7]|uniref:phage/plasmid primase, P4 family n=1 Tax=Natronococcus sp. A-GB7 TaxID=3037649 RepID=UPI00241DF026|nr:phage/plasmid primase, P4 family [Natronococcus sp. A-GB7]MDG5821838.1 phage/plasmid primase, P4 family [Natronococcus sp. A-GB7]
MYDTSNDTPRRPHWRGNFGVSWSDPDSWHTFEEAVEAADERASWGIGYVMAADNDDYTPGVYGCVDIDGAHLEDGSLRDWVPDLSVFTDALTYMEYSPSGNGLHIPIVASDVPDWWSDSQIDDHEGVDVLTNKFCTFTGDTHADSGGQIAGVDPTPWLFEAYQNIRGESPHLGDSSGSQSSDYDGGEWLEPSDVEDALNCINPDIEHPEWLRLGFAVHDYDSGSNGRSIFESWSRRGSKWDDQAESIVEHIWQNADKGSGVTVATLIDKAKQNGWSVPKANNVAGDGGVTTADPSASVPDVTGETLTPSMVRVYAGLEEDDSISDLNDRQKAAYVWELAKESENVHVRVSRDNGELWAFDPETGTWNPDGERALRHAARKALGAVNYGENVLNELKAQINADPEVEIWNDEFGLEAGMLAVKNGLLDLEKAYNDDPDAIRDLEPEDYALTRLSAEYDPEADGSTWKPFVGEVVESGMIPTVQEYIGDCLHRESLYERALLLVGGGENGKSTFLNVIEELLGDDNTTSVSPFDFGDKPSLAEMHGGLANISVELEGGSLQGKNLANFKKMTGGDSLQAKRLYQSPFEFAYDGGMLFATNEVPDVPVSDDDTAFWRRWIIVHFDNQFPEGSDKRDPTLGNRLQEPENLSAVLNWAIEGWGRLLENGEFDNVPPTPDETRRKWQSWGDSLDYFLSNVAEYNPDAPNITTGEAWEVYRAWCLENGHDFVGQNKFTSAAKDSDFGYSGSVRPSSDTSIVRRGYTAFGTVDEVSDPIDVLEGDDSDDDDDRDGGHNAGLDGFEDENLGAADERESGPTNGELKEHAQLFVANSKGNTTEESEVHTELVEEFNVDIEAAEKAAKNSRLTYHEESGVYSL